jgi:hypothetical protein
MMAIGEKSAEDAGNSPLKQVLCRVFTKPLRFAGKAVPLGAATCFSRQRFMAKAKNVTCEDCYFRRNLLCALRLDEPCATFRPDHPDGLRPPQQMRFVFRQERRTQATWAFPSAQEQAALHR